VLTTILSSAFIGVDTYVVQVEGDSQKLLEVAIKRLGMSARAYDRILKVSRTITALDENDQIQLSHVSEAIQYRDLDRDFWSK
jgi:magnesium chelatase family protein